MIQANELRIGNWVNHTNRNGTFTLKVEEVTTKGVRCIYDGGGWFVPYDELQGIPLTEEILLKVGFVEQLHGFELGLISIYLESSNYPKGRVYFNSWAIIKERPQTLHQLQNLYFALTGKELEVI